MSTPNPAEVIAEHMCSYHGPSNADKVSYCWCGWSGEDHSAHVVSKLTDAGYSIVHLPDPESIHLGEKYFAAGLYKVDSNGALWQRCTQPGCDPWLPEQPERLRNRAAQLLAAAAEGEKP